MPEPGLGAARAWRDGDVTRAIEVADRVLAAGADPDGSAAAVVAAAAAADGALTDGATRWRRIAEMHAGAAAVPAAAHAALLGALGGRLAVAATDLGRARSGLADPAPRGTAVLIEGVAAVLDGVRGDLLGSARRLRGLAVATVPADLFAVERWDDLAVELALAGSADAAATAMLAARPDPTPLRSLLTAWVDLRTARFTHAGAALAAAATAPVMRRDALLAAVVAVGLARRSGDPEALATAWHRAAPVVAGSEVEVLRLDVWGELSVAAAVVAPAEAEDIAAAMDTTVVAAGSPSWCAPVLLWWRLQRAIATGAPVASLAGELCGLDAVRGAAAAAWAAVLDHTAEPAAVLAAATGLAAAGRPWEARQLCGAAAALATEPATARVLLGTGRDRPQHPSDDLLTEREREIGRLVLDGFTHREIGARLYLSPKTVEQHVGRMRRKVLAGNRAELMAALRVRLG
ncbi:helix-turn-helix transcriptional regulator [Pseudonocardia sp. GCM10023141]|uniref:helix-turn-helix transcriptional regulator n=1 Tax=Pseudonocardia sp. GCM10023141 TaxID=3252653 RepID=UPI0036D2D2B5